MDDDDDDDDCFSCSLQYRDGQCWLLSPSTFDALLSFDLPRSLRHAKLNSSSLTFIGILMGSMLMTNPVLRVDLVGINDFFPSVHYNNCLTFKSLNPDDSFTAMGSLCLPFNLLDLPEEILLQIIEKEVCPDDLENFALCSKAIFFMASRRLNIHRTKKRKFSTFIVGDVHLYNGHTGPIVARQQHPVFALERLLAESAIPDYCQILRIGGMPSNGTLTGRYEHDVTQEASTIAGGLYDRLAALVGIGPYLYHPHGTDKQRELYCQAFYVPLITLRNIETLELVDCAGFIRTLPIFSIMRETHHRLKAIGLFGKWNCSYSTPSDILCQFARIPSIRRMYGLGVGLGSRSPAFRNVDSGTLYPSLEELHFERSRIDCREFRTFLSHIPELKIFFYDHTPMAGYDYGPGRVLAALKNYASESLESLTFIDRYRMTVVTVETTCLMKWSYGTLVGSLRGFKVLKHVAIECCLIINDQHDGNVAPLQSTLANRWGRDICVSRLVDVLPPSLETLELYQPYDFHIASAFSGLRELREERLPKLRTVSIQRKTRMERQIREDCQHLGIELISTEGPKLWWPEPPTEV